MRTPAIAATSAIKIAVGVTIEAQRLTISAAVRGGAAIAHRGVVDCHPAIDAWPGERQRPSAPAIAASG